jgi:[ribosomal protein S5]-alanine N-acetyltransferase
VTETGRGNSVELATARLLIRIARASDAEALADYFCRNRAHLEPWDPPRPARFFSPEFWIDRIGKDREEAAREQTLRFVLLAREDSDAIVGTCALTQISRGPVQSAQLGYGLDFTQVGKGLAHEALVAVIAHAFTELRLARLTANYMPTNDRSGRLLRRLGFVVEGYARDSVFINGAWRDHVLTSLHNPRPDLVRVG